VRLLRWRAAVTIVGAVVVLGYLWASGRSGYTVPIDYSWTGGMLEGAEVIIDDEVAGTLQMYSNAVYATGFKVEAGRHTVCVVHQDCPGGRDYEVTVGRAEGRLAILMADMVEEYACRVVLR
jgi:hypothetical protein